MPKFDKKFKTKTQNYQKIKDQNGIEKEPFKTNKPEKQEIDKTVYQNIQSEVEDEPDDTYQPQKPQLFQLAYQKNQNNLKDKPDETYQSEKLPLYQTVYEKNQSRIEGKPDETKQSKKEKKDENVLARIEDKPAKTKQLRKTENDKNLVQKIQGYVVDEPAETSQHKTNESKMPITFPSSRWSSLKSTGLRSEGNVYLNDAASSCKKRILCDVFACYKTK